jgi:hypothetical protein
VRGIFAPQLKQQVRRTAITENTMTRPDDRVAHLTPQALTHPSRELHGRATVGHEPAGRDLLVGGIASW